MLEGLNFFFDDVWGFFTYLGDHVLFTMLSHFIILFILFDTMYTHDFSYDRAYKINWSAQKVWLRMRHNIFIF